MTLQNRPNNPIAQRKQAVRRYARTGVIGVSAGAIGGPLLGFAFGDLRILLLGLVVAVAVGGYSWMKIQKIVNHKDN